MKKNFVKIVISIAIALMFTACGSNAGTGASETKAEDQAENPADIQEESQVDIQKESQAAVQEENGTEPQQVGEPTKDDSEAENEEEKGGLTEMKMNVQVGEYNFTATLESNTAVEELIEMMREGAVTIEMDDYSGFEKVGPLGKSLTASNSQTTTHAGDIVLYNGNNIVMFYGSNSWSYTRIGRIDDLTDWEKALGSGSITTVFTVAE